MWHQKYTINAVFIVVAWTILALGNPSPAVSAMLDYCSQPPFIGNPVTPNVLFVLDNSGSMNCAAYPGNYNPPRFIGSGNYFGLFDPTKMYRYDGNAWAVTTADSASATAANPLASGNLLNWATMRRFDVAKTLLNGGKANPRSPNPGFTVKLEGEVPNNGAYCDNDQTVGRFNNSGAIPESHLPSPYTNVIYPFSGNYNYELTHDGLNVIPVNPVNSDFETVPNANISVPAAWTVTGETSAYRAVDDTPPSYDTSTYIETTTVASPAILDYRYNDTKTGTITNVQVVVVARKSISNRTQRIQGMLRISGSNIASSYVSVSDTSYDTYTFDWAVNPATTLAWQWSEIRSIGTESLEGFGVQIYSNASSSNVLRVTQIYLVVSVATPEGGPYKVIIDTGKTTADTGIIGALSGDARFGLATYNTDSDGAQVLNPVDFGSPTSMLVSVDNMKAVTATPLAETLHTTIKYFRQDANPYHPPQGDYKRGAFSVDDPYYFMYSKLPGSTIGDRYVPCAKSFILLMTDGEPTSDSWFPDTTITDSDSNGSRLDNFALWGRTADARPGSCTGGDQSTWTYPCLPNPQNIYTYSVFMFGRGSTLLKKTAINGGFEDLNSNGVPPCYNTAPGHPTQDELKGCYRDSNEDGTIDPATDFPLTYFEGDDGYELKESIINAIAAIMKRAASGTAVSVLTTSSRGAGSLLQAYFLPKKQDGVREITWTGYTQNIWLDPQDNLREDTINDLNLIQNEDYVIKLYFDTSAAKTMAATFTTTADGTSDAATPGTLASCSPATAKDFANVNYLWEGGKKLARKDPSTRSIFTSKKSIAGGTTTTLDSTTTARQPAFDTSMSATLKAALNGDATYTADNIIRYVRGECLETGVSDDSACGATSNTVYRDRRIAVSGGSTNGNVWKLGDIITSTPKVFSNTPLNTYHIVYSDGTYTSYISTDEYKKRTSTSSSLAFIGANDGMLHAFRVGYLKDKTDTYGTLAATVKAVYKNFFTVADTANDELGQEVWAYIPYNAFPYLKYLADPTYCHIYYNDLSVNLVDVSLGGTTNPNPTDAKDVNSWKTILIGGMRFGGACSGGISPTGAPAGTPANVGFASFYALDITNPESPVPLWEFTDPDLGYATTYPAVLRTGAPSGQNGYWYVAIGSGSKQLPKYATDINRTTTGYIYLLDLKTGAIVKKIALDHNAIVGDILAIDADYNYLSEKIYFGTAYKDTTWKGKLVSIAIPNQDLTSAWTPTVKNVFAGNYPFTASPDAVRDENRNVWIYAGSGKYYSSLDQVTTAQEIFLGIKDVSSTTVTTTNLDNRTTTDTIGTVTGTTQTCMYDANATTPGFAIKTLVTSISPTSATVSSSLTGWYMNLSTSPTAERVISRPLAIGGLVDFLTFKPNSDVCAAGGDSYLYSLGYTTGVAPTNVAILSPDVTGGVTTGSVTVKKGVKLGPGAPPTGEAIIIPPPKEGQDKLKKKIQVATGVIVEAENEPTYSLTNKIIQWLKK